MLSTVMGGVVNQRHRIDIRGLETYGNGTSGLENAAIIHFLMQSLGERADFACVNTSRPACEVQRLNRQPGSSRVEPGL